ncbi:MAG: substrate-binding domain-containing protein [Candidatus Natronoplasma sp.]
MLAVTIILSTTGLVFSGCIGSGDELMLATTTSTYDSGLLDEIIPYFEEEHDVDVKITAVGTGQALEMGKRGDADVLLVHAPDIEEEFVKDGYGRYRYDVMYNEFVIVGPEEDPAGLNGLTDTDEAFNRIYDNQSTFSSRGDGSGTHVKEMELWESAGFDYDNQIDDPDSGWYNSLGQGMGDTLRFADEKDSYTLTDEGTYISMQQEIDDLDIHVRGDEALFNQYGVIAVDGARDPELAEGFAEWIISKDVQDMIDNYTIDGKKVFTANA